LRTFWNSFSSAWSKPAWSSGGTSSPRSRIWRTVMPTFTACWSFSGSSAFAVASV
jgi:hypothetical protein